MYKQCSKCLDVLELEQFHKMNRGKYGRHSVCKECRKKSNNNLINCQEKECKQCHQILEIDEFYRNNQKKSGYLSICKECYNSNKHEIHSDKRYYIELVIDKFHKKFPNYFGEITVEMIIDLIKKQNNKCLITNQELTYLYDKSGWNDSIWNMMMIEMEGKLCIVSHFIYTCILLYNFDLDKIRTVYQSLLSV